MELRSGKASGVCGIHGEALKAGENMVTRQYGTYEGHLRGQELKW